LSKPISLSSQQRQRWSPDENEDLERRSDVLRLLQPSLRLEDCGAGEEGGEKEEKLIW
jgi:hypothetical protein